MMARTFQNPLLETPMVPIYLQCQMTGRGVRYADPALGCFADTVVVDGPITGQAYAPACKPGLAVSSSSASTISSATYVNPNPLACSTIM